MSLKKNGLQRDHIGVSKSQNTNENKMASCSGECEQLGGRLHF